MALINYSEYFDLDGFNAAIKTLDSTNKEFGTSVLSLNKEIKTSYGGIRSELKDYVEMLSKFNVNQRDAATRLTEVSVASEQLRSRYEAQEAAMQGLTQVQDLSNRSVKELKLGLKELKTQYEAVNGASDDAKAKKAALAAEARRLKEAIDLENNALKVTKTVVDEAAGSYNAMSQEARQILTQLKAMPTAFDAVTGKINQQNAEAVRLGARYVELNGNLKNIDAGLGNFQRNVGNYKSGFNGLGNSINQITREFPAFANSVQTGFLALSNNIPIFFDEIARTNKEIKALRAEGQQVPGMFKALTSSLFSFSTVLSLGVTLLTIFGKDLVDFVEKALAGAKKFNEITEAANLMSKALKDTGALKAVEDINKLKENIQLAKDGFISKEGVVKQYNDTIGKTTGLVKSLEEAEESITKKGDAYIKYTLLKTAANLAAQESAKKLLEAEEVNQKNSQEFNTLKNRATVFSSGQSSAPGFVPGMVDPMAAAKARTDAAKKNQANLVKEKNDEAAGLDKIFKKFQSDAAKIAADNKFNFFDDTKEDKGEAKKALREYERLLKDREAALKAAYDAEVALAQEQLDNRIIDEVGFQKTKQSAALKYSVEGVKLEREANSVGYKADEARVKEFINFKKKADNDYNRAAIKANDEARKEDIVLLQQSIQDAADIETESLKNTQTFVLSNQQITNLERKGLELDFQNEIDAIAIKALKDRAEIELDSLKKTELLKKAALLQNGVNSRTELFNKITKPQEEAKLEIEALERRLQIKKTFGISTIEEEIAIAKRIKDIKEKNNLGTLAEIEAQNQKIAELTKQGQDKLLAYLKEGSTALRPILGSAYGDIFDDLINGFQKVYNKGKLTYDDLAKAAIDSGNAITQSRKENIAIELSALQNQKEQELAAVGNNASAQAAINAKYKREEAALKRKQAKADRDNALFQIAVNTATAVAKAVAASPLTFGLPFSAFALSVGALQAAFVLSKKLPEFRKGTEHAPEGHAIVDEDGPEMIIGPDGRIREIGGKGPRITYLEKGSKVKTATETKRMLQGSESDKIVREIEMMSKASASMNSFKQNEAIYVMGQALQRTGMNEKVIAEAFRAAIKEIPIHQTIIDREGERLRVLEGNNRTTYLNSFKLSR